MPIPYLQRSSPWAPPTFLDKILDSPLRVLAIFLYHLLLKLRGAPFTPPPNKAPIRIVCISDTHTNQPPVPEGDLLIHAGDLTNAGTVDEIQAQIDWLDGLPHRYKLLVAGNHDSWFDEESRKSEDKESGRQVDLKGVKWLQDESVRLEFAEGRVLNVYGAGDIPKCGGRDFAFQYNRQSAPWAGRIPLDTDVLITHTPPRHHLDISLGCSSLLSSVWSVKPRLHVFGHVHSGAGTEACFWDEAQSAYERLMERKGGIVRDLLPSEAWVDLIKMVGYGVRGVLWQRLMVGAQGANGTLMVNAAMVWQTTTKVGHSARIVKI